MKVTDLRIWNFVADRGGKEWQVCYWETMDKVASIIHTTMYNDVLMEVHPFSEYVDYPKQTNEHNALADAKWNLELFKFINALG